MPFTLFYAQALESLSILIWNLKQRFHKNGKCVAVVVLLLFDKPKCILDDFILRAARHRKGVFNWMKTNWQISLDSLLLLRIFRWAKRKCMKMKSDPFNYSIRIWVPVIWHFESCSCSHSYESFACKKNETCRVRINCDAIYLILFLFISIHIPHTLTRDTTHVRRTQPHKTINIHSVIAIYTIFAICKMLRLLK